jgi:hypothetical protein
MHDWKQYCSLDTQWNNSSDSIKYFDSQHWNYCRRRNPPFHANIHFVNWLRYSDRDMQKNDPRHQYLLWKMRALLSQ